MIAAEMTFGIEIETTIPAGRLSVGPHGAGYDIPGLAGWKADRDPSIRASRGREACEFVSPIFRGIEGLKQFKADLALIREMDANVNGTCGVHIHIGFNRSDLPATERLTTLVSNFEKAIYASTGTKNRERGRWCGGLNHYGSAELALQGTRRTRYHILNLISHHQTVEFRPFSASLNQQKMIGWIRLCIALVEKAVNAKRIPKWNAPVVAETSPLKRKGEGQTHLTRLFYGIGWTKGDRQRVCGDLTGDGLPSLATSKRTLMALARKYDAQP